MKHTLYDTVLNKIKKSKNNSLGIGRLLGDGIGVHADLLGHDVDDLDFGAFRDDTNDHLEEVFFF